jgi:hypothetical protein
MSIQIDQNRAPSALRFPKVASANGKKYRIRINRVTLRRVSAQLRVLNRRAKQFHANPANRARLVNPFRQAYNGLLDQVRAFETQLAKG